MAFRKYTKTIHYPIMGDWHCECELPGVPVNNSQRITKTPGRSSAAISVDHSMKSNRLRPLIKSLCISGTLLGGVSAVVAQDASRLEKLEQENQALRKRLD